MTQEWQQFMFAMFVQLLFPLLISIIEFALTGKVSDQTLAVTAAMYTINVGVSSRNLALLALCIFVAFLFAAISGVLISGNGTVFISVKYSAAFSAIIILPIHVLERFKRHVTEGELFIELGTPRV